MTRLYMLDTNMVSFILNGRSLAARHQLNNISGNQSACISTITEAELLFGIAKSGNGELQRRMLTRVLANFAIFVWDSKAAAAYGTLRAEQKAQGHPLQPLDTQIAAHALAVGATLVTHDRAFRHVDSLLTEDWATDRP